MSCVNRTRWSRMRTRSEEPSAPQRSLLALFQLHARHAGEKRVAFERAKPHEKVRAAKLVRIAFDPALP